MDEADNSDADGAAALLVCLGSIGEFLDEIELPIRLLGERV
jgi:hypothetical protein